MTVTIDSAASNHPLSYFEPDPNGTWADGNWITPSGTYTIHVGGSSADTPLETTVNLDVVEPPFRLRIVSGTIDLRGTAPRRVQAVLSLPPPYSLSNMQIMDVRFEGTPALSTALSSDGRALMATFDGRDLKRLTAGQNVTVSLAADILRGGTPDKLGEYNRDGVAIGARALDVLLSPMTRAPRGARVFCGGRMQNKLR